VKKWILLIGIAALAAVVHEVRGREIISLHYGASLVDLPADAQTVRVWLPLATDRDGQKILKREIHASVPYQLTRETVYGNEIIYAELESPFPEKVEFGVDYRAKLSKRDYWKSNDALPSELQTYLKPTRLMVVDDEIRRRAREAAREGGTTFEKARGIYDQVIARVEYDKTIAGWGNGDSARACLIGKGNCTDFHSLFISMALAERIPARFKIGFTVPEGGSQNIAGYHCWAEFYDSQKGWVPVDASEAWKHPERKDAYFGGFDAHKFLISTGRDIQLVPRQDGDPVNIFFYPYVEADGAPFDGAKTSFRSA
jgi:transglutaminase-like putative cysteine protease